MIWLIGKNGMLGQEVARQLEEAHLPWVGTGSEVDVTDANSLDTFERSIETAAYFPSSLPHQERQIKWIINCSGYTNVDKAEEDSDAAYKINREGACNIARQARKIGAKLIHISTDYVFDGKASQPYTEDAVKNAQGIYAKSKSEGEDAIEKEMNQYYIIRTSWLYGFNKNNFVYTMTKLMNSQPEIKVVNDQKGSPTFTCDLAEVILRFIKKSEGATSFFGKNSAPAYGIYHFSNEGETTWFDFAKEIYRLGKKYNRVNGECSVAPCSTEDFGAKAPRPAYSVLSKEKIKKTLKIKIPSWQSSLEYFIKNKNF